MYYICGFNQGRLYRPPCFNSYANEYLGYCKIANVSVMCVIVAAFHASGDLRRYWNAMPAGALSNAHLVKLHQCGERNL